MRGSICWLLLLTSCFPNQFIEPDIGEVGAKPSPERGRKILLNRSYLKVGVPVTLVDALKTPVFEP